MLNSIRNLLDWEEGADVKFKVKGERFSIPTRWWSLQGRALRTNGCQGERFSIPTRYGFSRVCSISSTSKDLLPTMDYVDGDEKEEMVKHFLVAADRYAMERVKVMCSHFRTSWSASMLPAQTPLYEIYQFVEQSGWCGIKWRLWALKKSMPISHCGNMGKKSATARKISKNGNEVTRSTSTRLRLG
jgi:hypothetical protein